MSDEAAPPTGVSKSDFKSMVADVGGWIWGTVEGAFNERQSISQMVVDAAIGMIPLLGDVTAVRDLIAVAIGLVEDPRKREDKWQWMLLVVFICALIPVFGGVIKGVGRVLIDVMGDAAKILEASERSARLLGGMRNMVELLNRLGVGNAEKWLKELNFAKYQTEIISHINELLTRMDGVFAAVKRKVGWAVPESVLTRITALQDNLRQVKALVGAHIPDAVKELDQNLREIQQLIYSGGENTSRLASHAVESGARNLSYTEELVLLEGKGATRSARGGFVQNGSGRAEISQWYKPELGFPDLTAYTAEDAAGEEVFPLIATYSGQIVNREIQPGETIFRVFGPAGSTHAASVGDTFAAGSREKAGVPSFWGLNEVPTDAESWRQGSAVLDEWNHDGFVLVGEVLPGHSPLGGSTGIIAEQKGGKLGVQYLKGGNKQVMMIFPADVSNQLNAMAARVQATGAAESLEAGGVLWEVRPTGWTDVNGVYGYLNMPGPGTIQISRLGARELAGKKDDGSSN